MSADDSFVLYIKATALGKILTARYEIHDGESWSIIGGQEMTETWALYTPMEKALQRLYQSALTETLNVPTERQVGLDLDGF